MGMTNEARIAAEEPVTSDPALSAVAMLRERLGSAVLESRDEHRCVTVRLEREVVVEALRLLRDAPEFAFRTLVDLTAVDYATTGREPRFDVVYSVRSRTRGARLRLVVGVPEGDETVPTATGVFAGADWLEREVYDLMGLGFEGHPDLRRIELPDDYDGHPLRKEFPVRGGHRQVRRPEDPEPRFGHRFRVR